MRPYLNRRIVVVSSIPQAEQMATLRQLSRWSNLTPAAASVVFQHQHIPVPDDRVESLARPARQGETASQVAARLQNKRVILLGLHVAEAFGLRREPWYAWAPGKPRTLSRDWMVFAVAPLFAPGAAWPEDRDNLELRRAFWAHVAETALVELVEHYGDKPAARMLRFATRRVAGQTQA